MAEVLSLTPLHVLLIEDTASDAEYIQTLFEELPGQTFTVTLAENIAAALQHIAAVSYQIVLLDLTLPDVSGLEGLQRIQSAAPALPVVILTQRDDAKLALDAVQNGAQDYLQKNDINASSLTRSIFYAIQRKKFEDTIIRQANFDKLTGLTNRVLFESRLEMAVARSRRNEQGIGVFFLDLNGFKQVNDLHGHAAGDLVLQETARRLMQSVRPYDTAARFGGDEFALLVEGISSPRDCAAVAQKIIGLMETPVGMGSRQVQVGVSIGIATSFGYDRRAGPTLLTQADEAMYRAKSASKSCYRFYTDDMQHELQSRLTLESELRSALQKGELTLCYQPRQMLNTGELCGVEALVRWNHPQRGLMLPAEFIAIAEETGIANAIDQWVIEAVCSDIRRWQSLTIPPVQVSINLSAQQLDTPRFAEDFAAVLHRESINMASIALEFPESVFLSSNLQREQNMARLAKTGVTLCVDGYGGEAASLLALRSVLLSVLKLHTQFVRQMEQGPEHIRLVKAVIMCAHQLGLTVVASGVESEWLRACLKDQHCDQIQGFVFSRPMPSAFLEEWLDTRQPLPPRHAVN